MKKTIIMMLCMALLLCGCAGEKETSKADAPEKEILPEIVSAYDIDETGKKQVAELFDDLDKAFEDLSDSDLADEDFYDYANEVSEIISDFEDSFDSEAPSRKLDNVENDEEKLELISAMSDRANKLITPGSELSFALFEAMTGETSGENCAEKAFAVVNAYSTYYYGEAHITDEELDSLG